MSKIIGIEVNNCCQCPKHDGFTHHSEGCVCTELHEFIPDCKEIYSRCPFPDNSTPDPNQQQGV